MLANDSNEGKNQSEFFLVIRPHDVRHARVCSEHFAPITDG